MIKAANIIEGYLDPQAPADVFLAILQLEQLRPEDRHDETEGDIGTTKCFMDELKHTFFEIILQVRYGSDEQTRLLELSTRCCLWSHQSWRIWMEKFAGTGSVSALTLHASTYFILTFDSARRRAFPSGEMGGMDQH
jgi:hypothetical protein